MTTGAGVDVFTFGGTKNGLLYGEAVVFLRPGLASRARFASKQAGQLASKMRFVSAQFDAILTGDLWLRNARHANDMSTRLAATVTDLPAVEVIRAPQANSILARLAHAAIAPLQEWSFFWVWDDEQNIVRWMTSFATTPEDVSRFADGLRAADVTRS
jgi:threonine aldolase